MIAKRIQWRDKMFEEYLKVRRERSIACVNGDSAKEEELDNKLGEISKKLTKDDIEELLKRALNYNEKIYWKSRLDKGDFIVG